MLLLTVVPRARGFQRRLLHNGRLLSHRRSMRLDALDSRRLRFYARESYINSINVPGLMNINRNINIGHSFFPAAAQMAAEAVLAHGASNGTSMQFASLSASASASGASHKPKRSYGPYISLSPEERELFRLLRRAREETGLTTTLRVAGGWVRDKLLSTPEFARTNQQEGRLTSKYKQQASMGRQGVKVMNSDENHPVDIDIALDDMLGREFAESLNEYLARVGEETHSVGVVLKNPEKSKHLETATMQVGSFWIDFVNLRAEEYTQDSRIPDLMRIGTPEEDAFRRDLTINALFYNVNNGQVEDWTGRGFDDLRRGVVSTPLAPLTTLLDDPLRALRSIRFAARLRFTMDDALIEAAMHEQVRQALAEKVSRERVGGEVDLMLRSRDPVGAMRLLINLHLVRTVFPLESCFTEAMVDDAVFHKGLELLSTSHEHLSDCRVFPPTWCQPKGTYTTHGVNELTLSEDENARRFLWYASFLKPLYDDANKMCDSKKSRRQEGRKATKSTICKLLVDELKRPTREAEAVEKIMQGANDFTRLMTSGCDISAVSVLLGDIRVEDDTDSQDGSKLKCSMGGRTVFSATEDDPLWLHAMELRLLCCKIVKKVGPLWRASLFLSLSEHMAQTLQGDLEYAIEGDVVSELTRIG
jgi:tRNA nucleotidyltransferase/poly(A) polymerase